MSTCNRNCGKLCETPEIERSWTPIKKLNCDDNAYIANIITDLEKARDTGDVERVLQYAREYERFLILCGNSVDPTMKQFERAIFSARDALKLHDCKVIQRSLNPINTPKTPIRGFGGGFMAMVEQATGSHEPQQQIETPTPKREGFMAMAQEAFKHVERQASPIIESTHPTGTIIDPTTGFPLICNKECPHTQCSSWGTLEMEGEPCRNRTKTNDEISPPERIQIRMFGDY